MQGRDFGARATYDGGDPSRDRHGSRHAIEKRRADRDLNRRRHWQHSARLSIATSGRRHYGFFEIVASGVYGGVALTTYHAADANRDGLLSLFELTRVIELYNARSGTTRTGAYHVATTPTATEDGFAPGP